MPWRLKEQQVVCLPNCSKMDFWRINLHINSFFMVQSYCPKYILDLSLVCVKSSWKSANTSQYVSPMKHLLICFSLLLLKCLNMSSGFSLIFLTFNYSSVPFPFPQTNKLNYNMNKCFHLNLNVMQVAGSKLLLLLHVVLPPMQFIQIEWVLWDVNT